MSKKVIKGILAVLIVLVVIVAYLFNMPKANIKSKEVSTTTTAVDLYASYSKNETQANSLYSGQVISVKGIVSEIETDRNGATILFLSTNDGFTSVMCTLQKTPKVLPKEGAEVTIKGLCTGLLMDVILNKCILL